VAAAAVAEGATAAAKVEVAGTVMERGEAGAGVTDLETKALAAAAETAREVRAVPTGAAGCWSRSPRGHRGWHAFVARVVQARADLAGALAPELAVHRLEVSTAAVATQMMALAVAAK